MNRLYRPALLLLLLCAALSPSPLSPRATAADSTPEAEAVAQSPAVAQSTPAPIHMGIISYWKAHPNKEWDSIPDGSVVVINPASGILKWNSDEAVENTGEWKNVVENLKDESKHRGVIVLGYVPTGYFRHEIKPGTDKCSPTKKDVNPHCQEWKRIRLQVETYYNKIKKEGEGESWKLDGIFYDETAPKNGITTSFEKEFDDIRQTNEPGRTTIFNVGTYNLDALNATREGEHIILYESAPNGYSMNNKQALSDKLAKLTAPALQKQTHEHVKVWHLLHTVGSEKDMCTYVKLMAANHVDYGYVTNISEGEAWDRPPKYWAKELKVFAAPDKPCVELLKD